MLCLSLSSLILNSAVALLILLTFFLDLVLFDYIFYKLIEPCPIFFILLDGFPSALGDVAEPMPFTNEDPSIPNLLNSLCYNICLYIWILTSILPFSFIFSNVSTIYCFCKSAYCLMVFLASNKLSFSDLIWVDLTSSSTILSIILSLLYY